MENVSWDAQDFIFPQVWGAQKVKFTHKTRSSDAQGKIHHRFREFPVLFRYPCIEKNQWLLIPWSLILCSPVYDFISKKWADFSKFSVAGRMKMAGDCITSDF